MKKYNRRTVQALALLMLVLSFMVSNKPSINSLKYNYAYYFTDYMKIFSALGNQFKIDIIYNINNDFLKEDIFDVSLINSASKMSDFELSRYSVLLPKFFSKYPKSIIQDELKTIKLAGSLTLYSVFYGGTSIGSTLYLTSLGYDKGYTDEYIEKLFHHEFSSILMRNHEFPQNAWNASNVTEFKYAQTNKEIRRAIAEDTGTVGNHGIYSRGFLTKYSMSTLENDFNVMAEQVFTDPGRLKTLIQQYPIIRKKYELLRIFYLDIDPKFINVFDKLN